MLTMEFPPRSMAKPINNQQLHGDDQKYWPQTTEESVGKSPCLCLPLGLHVQEDGLASVVGSHGDAHVENLMPVTNKVEFTRKNLKISMVTRIEEFLWFSV